MDKTTRKRKFAKEKYNQFKGNKAEGQGFTDVKKKKAIQEYKKLMRKELKAQGEGSGKAQQGGKSDSRIPQGRGGKPSHTRAGHGKLAHSKTTQPPPAKKGRYFKEELKFEKEKNEKQQQQREFEQTQKARNEALETYDRKRKQQHKVLVKKNFRGQPKLGNQIGLLLEKIEASRKT